MKIGSNVDERRKEMLTRLGRSELGKSDHKRMVRAMGYKGAMRAVDPARNKPPVDNTHRGMERWVQTALNVILGLKLKNDGRFGPITRAAIKRFQRQEGLTAHGYVDERTMQVLELRVGVKAPRTFHHEAIPHLLMMPRRGVWKPGKDKGKGKGKDRKRPDDVQAGEDKRDQAHGTGARHGEGEEEFDVDAVPAPGLLQNEAMSATLAQAFDNDFARLAADRLQRGEEWKAVQKEMHTWVDELRSAPPLQWPRWLRRVGNEARGHDQQAASRLRRRWWSAHVDEGL